MNKQIKNLNGKGDQLDIEIEILKMLHEGRQGTLTFLSERGFTATLQAITLNVVALGALIASGKTTFIPEAKVLGTTGLIVFNLLIAQYLFIKNNRYQKLKKQLVDIENALIQKCPSIKGMEITNNSWSSSWSGTGLFIFAIIVSCSCTIIALWKNPVVITN